MAAQGSSGIVGVEAAEIVRREVRRIVESPVFRQSKRCCRLLSYVVEASLEERWDHLRERSLGVALFQRPADYGTTEDAVVRVAAAEVRKRLAQYYGSAGVVERLRIELPAGGYVPQFVWTEDEPPPPSAIELELNEVQTSSLTTLVVKPSDPLNPLLDKPEPAPARRHGKSTLAVAGICVAAWLVFWFWPQSKFEVFWKPAIDDKEPVLVCLGLVNALTSPVPPADFSRKSAEACETPAGCSALVSKIHPIAVSLVPAGDAVGLAQIMSFLGKKGKAFRVRGSANTTYSDLNESDSILIGYFSNAWTIETFKNARFHLVPGTMNSVVDSQHPEKQDWSIPSPWPNMTNEIDYAIVARIMDEKTGKTRLVAAGMTPFGTEAAARFLASEKQLNAALARLAKGWESRNVQWILRTHVQAMGPGPAEVLASHVW